jgi:hypothetical protein
MRHVDALQLGSMQASSGQTRTHLQAWQSFQLPAWPALWWLEQVVYRLWLRAQLLRP